MNFKDWEKLEEDDNTVTMQHPRGHVMTIAVRALPKIQQEQIKRLKFSGGGSVSEKAHRALKKSRGQSVQGQYVEEDDMNKAKESAQFRAEKEKKVKPNIQGLAHGGEVDEGESEQGSYVREAHELRGPAKHSPGHAEMKDDANKAAKRTALKRAESQRRLPKPNIKGLARGGKVQYYDEGTPTEPVQPDQQDPSQGPTGNHTPITINVGASAPAAPVPAQAQVAPVAPPPMAAQQGQAKPFQLPSRVESVDPAVQYGQAPNGVDVPQVPAGRPNLNPDGTMNPSAVAENTQTANEAQKNIDVAKAKMDAQRESGLISGEMGLEDRRQNRLGELKQVTDNAAQAILAPENNNPRYYQENMSSGQKTTTAIGLMLGGFGVPFGGHNFAFDHMQKQIDRDIEGQRQRVNNQKTVLGAYENLYGKGVAADAMTKATMWDIYNAKVRQGAAQMGTAQAAKNALAAGANIAIEKSKALQEAAVDLNSLPGNRPNGKNGPVQGGGTAPANAPQGPQGKDEHPLQGTLLHPGSEQAYQALQYTPKAKDQMPEITRQFTQAQQADKALRSINDTFMHLNKAAEESGLSGRFHRTVDPHALPGSGMVGDAVKGVGYLLGQTTNSDINRQYDAQQSELKGYISSALKGTNIGSGDIDDIVSKNSPEYGDSAKTKAMKLKTIRDFIKNHTETSLLKTWHLTND